MCSYLDTGIFRQYKQSIVNLTNYARKETILSFIFYTQSLEPGKV